MLKTYDIEVQVPKIVVTVNAHSGTKARKLALEKVQEHILGNWPRDRDIESVTVVSKNRIYDPTIYAKNTPRKSKDYTIRFRWNNNAHKNKIN